MKKYELTDEKIEVCGKTLYRIRALRDFSNVSTGDLGGFVERESNLSHDGDAWIYDNAQVYGNAQVCGDAWVCGDAQVCGDAWVYDNAWVCGDADYTTIKGFGTEYRSTTFFRCADKSVKVHCGCFLGTIDEFRKRVKKTRSGKIKKEYLLIADLMEYHFSGAKEDK